MNYGLKIMRNNMFVGVKYDPMMRTIYINYFPGVSCWITLENGVTPTKGYGYDLFRSDL